MALLRLLALPVTGPLWIVRQVIREAERQYCDPQAVLAQLSELARRREMNEIGQDEFEEQETILMQRLTACRNKEAT